MLLRHRNRSLVRTASLAAVLALTAVACGSDEPESSASPTSSSSPSAPTSADPATTLATPSTIAGTAPSTTMEDVPLATRIVSLSPTATEMLFAIDAGDLIIAVDDQSNFGRGEAADDRPLGIHTEHRGDRRREA